MEAKPLTTESIALTEKKMDMTLDDIIKMSKKNTSKGGRPPRMSIKSRGFQNGNASQGNAKVQQFMDSTSSIRQGVLAQRRSSFHGNQFPATTEIARKAVAIPIRNRAVNRTQPRVATSVQRKPSDGSFTRKDKVVTKQRPQTLDALFADMKEQRTRMMSQQAMRGNGRQAAQRRNVLNQRRGRGGARGGSTQQFGNFGK